MVRVRASASEPEGTKGGGISVDDADAFFMKEFMTLFNPAGAIGTRASDP